jgi:hypothetical protein
MLPYFCSGVEYTAFLTVLVVNARESAQLIATDSRAFATNTVRNAVYFTPLAADTGQHDGEAGQHDGSTPCPSPSRSLVLLLR